MRSPRLSPEIAGLPILPAENGWLHAEIEVIEVAGRDCRDCRNCRLKMPRLAGCWGCGLFSPRLPKVLTKVVEVATEIAGRRCWDRSDCWDCRECRYWQDCWDRRDCRPRLQGFPTLPAESGWLHAQIEKIDEVSGRDCRDCRVLLPKTPRVQGLLGVMRMPNLQTETAKIVGRHCRDCSD